MFVPHVCRIDGDSDLWEDLVGACYVNDGWYIVSSCTPVALLGTIACGVAFGFRLFFFFPSGVVVLGQLRDVAVIGLEGFSRHCVGGWCYRGLGGLCKSERTVFSKLRRSW